MSMTSPGDRHLRLLVVIADMKEGGVQRVVAALTAALDVQRYQVTLLVLGAAGEFSTCLPPQLRVIYLYPHRWLRAGLFGARLATLLLGLRHDVLIAAAELRATFCVHLAARVLRKPAVLWVHIAFAEFAAGLSASHQRRSRAAYRDIHDVVFVAEGARRSMARWLGHEGAGWRVIPNPFSLQRYPQAVAETAAAAGLRNWLATRPTVIGIGRLQARKGFDLLIAAVAQAVHRGVDLELVLIGEGRQRAALERQAREAGIAARVHLPGFVHNPLQWLCAAQVYVLSSRLEGLPTTILEALSSGTPVIATDCPSGPAELLYGGRCGLLVAVDDVEALSGALCRLLASPELRAQQVQAGFQRLRDFDAGAIAAQWQRLFDELLAPPSALERAA